MTDESGLTFYILRHVGSGLVSELAWTLICGNNCLRKVVSPLDIHMHVGCDLVLAQNIWNHCRHNEERGLTFRYKYACGQWPGNSTCTNIFGIIVRMMRKVASPF